MLDLSRPVPIWSVLPYLGFLEHLFFLALIALSIYVLFVAVTTVVRARKIRDSVVPGAHNPDAEERCVALRRRSARVGKLITTAFYLFCCVLFMGVLNAYVVIDNSKVPTGYIVLEQLEPHFAFAANVFFVLLVLHLIGWFTSNSVDRLGLDAASRHAR
jgi:hypothetical protein